MQIRSRSFRKIDAKVAVTGGLVGLEYCYHTRGWERGDDQNIGIASEIIIKSDNCQLSNHPTRNCHFNSPLLFTLHSAMGEMSSHLRDAESLAQRHYEALSKAEMDIKASQDALTTVEEERDNERGRAEKAELKAEIMDGQMEAAKVRFDSKRIEPIYHYNNTNLCSVYVLVFFFLCQFYFEIKSMLLLLKASLEKAKVLKNFVSCEFVIDPN